VLGSPQISPVHATAAFDGARFHLRDESSEGGTYVDGQRVPPATWIPVRAGGSVRFGLVELFLQLQ
jgi:pSer/pThr/pTyr-binding forkhead associated (FHA) protein